MTTPTDDKAVILFDGVCNLCSGAVQFILRNDPKGHFRFASLQSAAGQKLLEQHKLPTDNISTIVLIEGGRAYTRSTAALRIARRLRGAYPLAYAAIVIPATLRNLAYAYVARNRYRWFGKAEHCMLPKPEFKQRFLE
ncbi:thiol-disulfide oxidoreductase DCC family protein [Paenibacillus aceris]|uniref:DCC family thiol-disulfide oxidoreductase YuxK n=1 Tax=Paenibacillus aceris TaxID=869555 RepID=A0ABS4I7N8_9BACL|nr:thiol-disulfide oxidoreductase DCC family protein [Paenibacillus aceris]MBP1966411.1 putative DCC family thiol-disulfide oxidoreductase YuxK [Paenibacillus aceris]NHW39608.1 thiol-disulfide oxidoreductase DCC family protein [Paenibacillus aceris]